MIPFLLSLAVAVSVQASGINSVLNWNPWIFRQVAESAKSNDGCRPLPRWMDWLTMPSGRSCR